VGQVEVQNQFLLPETPQTDRREHVSRGFTSLGYLVQSPRRNPWMPPPPPLTPPVLVLPDMGTLERVLAGLRRL
jgi:hypothetical protein